MKRQRGRGRKPGGGHYQNNQGHLHPNRAMESNGPDTKVRGPAAHIYERYLQLARDAASSGDRVLSENYLQHADHYFRLVRSMQPAMPPPQQNDRFSDNADYEGDEGQDGDAGEETQAGGEAEEQAEAEFSGERPQQGGQERDGDQRRRGRGRRNRFRPDSEREGAEAREGEGGEERAERSERTEGEAPREPRRERRPPRERTDDQGPEGFSHGPKPAFLRGGD
ncbi:MAG: DUF4167 domain-containing protein [Hyphomonadaceae bacterium]